MVVCCHFEGVTVKSVFFSFSQFSLAPFSDWAWNAVGWVGKASGEELVARRALDPGMFQVPVFPELQCE